MSHVLKLSRKLNSLFVLHFFIRFLFFRHPLFSLLALLLEKCEQATQGYVSSSNSSSPNGSTNGNCGGGGGGGDGDSFSRDIQAFVQLLEKEKRPLLTNDEELDGLVSIIIIVIIILS